MAVFVVVSVPPKNATALAQAVATNFENESLRLSDESWLVSTTETAEAVSKKIGVLGGAVGSAVVLGVNGYFGRANPTVWAWLKAKMEQPVSGQ
jgi:hypothetical protein